MYQKSNEPTKTKKAMKTKKFLSMAALALVGAMMTGCSNDDDSIIDNLQQPESKSKLVTLTTTVGLDGGATTRALTSTGTKTFAEGDQIAVIYTKNGGTVTKAVSEALPSGSYGANATFTVTLDDPDKTQDVTYIYPAAMAGTTGVDYSKLNSQTGGTLADLGSKYDLCTKSGAWSGDNLPTLTLENQLAILAIKLKNSSDITSSITGLTISDGTNNYAVSDISSASTIYVAIRPTSGASFSVIATAGDKYYGKYLTGRNYAVNNGYNVTWNMTPLTKVTWDKTNVFIEANENVELSSEPWASPYLTYEDIQISGVCSDAVTCFKPYVSGTGDTVLAVWASDSFTFTASGVKNFYKIEINGYLMNLNDANWSRQANGIVWSKAPSNTVTITASQSSTDFDNVTSMVFLTD